MKFDCSVDVSSVDRLSKKNLIFYVVMFFSFRDENKRKKFILFYTLNEKESLSKFKNK